ncbi:MAG: vWA domain-containing protein [Planctomycetaceae bacterium]
MIARELPGWGASLALHLAMALVLFLVHFSPPLEDMGLAVESMFEDDRAPEEFTRELSPDTTISESLSVAGAAGVTIVAGGTGAPAVTHTKIDVSEHFDDPTVVVNIGDVTLPGLEELGHDLGESQVAGEPTAVAEGYGAAMSRITQEIVRMLREEKLLVVWLFDESESMKDDQKQIRQEFHKVYEELGLVFEHDAQMARDKEILLTAIHSFGKESRAITPKPTADINEIRSAIDKIGIDQSGRENLFAALNKVLDQYRPVAAKTRRKLAIVIVSDESGDDGEGPLLDEVILKARKARAPVYVLGREAVFGFPIARIQWVDPKYGLTHWLEIHRGPETALAELLQFDGLHQRWDAHPSGFAPYEQARLTKETGGIFFVLPNEEVNIVGSVSADRRKFAFLDMKEYVPELVTRNAYEEMRSKSRLRAAVRDAVRLLNPFLDKELNIQEIWYSTDRDRFQEQGRIAFQRAMRGMGVLNQAIQLLERAKPLREQEASQRWRANFDLASAQVLAYRVRLFQFLLIADDYLNNLPSPPNQQHNVWNVRRTPQMTTPTERQVKLTRVDTEELQKQLDAAKAQFEFVRRTHPGTPWARRAEYELHHGFGMQWFSSFRDPRYDRRDITLPTL